MRSTKDINFEIGRLLAHKVKVERRLAESKNAFDQSKLCEDLILLNCTLNSLMWCLGEEDISFKKE